MRILLRFSKAKDKVVYVQGRRPKTEGHNLIFTSEEEEARIWNTLYAATDFVCKSATKLEGVEIIQLPEGQKTAGKGA